MVHLCQIKFKPLQLIGAFLAFYCKHKQLKHPFHIKTEWYLDWL